MSIVQLPKKIEYGLMALRHMASKTPGELTSAKEICDVYSTPFDGTARILQVMTGRGYLRSEQGVQGGYQIIRDLKRVTLLEFMESVLGRVAMARCLQSGGQPCELRTTCNIRGPVEVLNEKMSDFLNSIPLSDIVGASESVRETGTRSPKRTLFTEEGKPA